MIVGIAEIEAARERIAATVRVTPVDASPSLSAHTGVPVWLKQEHHQHTGSFKLRGATNAVAQLGPEERRRGVVAASTGNHGRALAYAARAAGLRAVICMSRLVPANKVEAIRALGADVKIVGKSQDDAQVEVERLVAEEGHGDGAAVRRSAGSWPGQGTLGLEMLDAVPDLACVLVQVSGGGLIAGIAAALKARRPAVRVIGVSMERGAAMAASLDAGHPVQVEELPTLADSLGGGIGLENRVTYPMVRDLVDEMVLLSEAEIAAGLRHCYWQERQVVEGAGGVGVAALLAGKVRPEGPTMLLLSGAQYRHGLAPPDRLGRGRRPDGGGVGGHPDPDRGGAARPGAAGSRGRGRGGGRVPGAGRWRGGDAADPVDGDRGVQRRGRRENGLRAGRRQLRDQGEPGVLRQSQDRAAVDVGADDPVLGQDRPGRGACCSTTAI